MYCVYTIITVVCSSIKLQVVEKNDTLCKSTVLVRLSIIIINQIIHPI